MLVLLLLLCFVNPSEELERTVQSYWDALLVQDKASALKYVHPEDLNNFISRREALFENWKLLQVDIKSQDEAVVKIQLQRVLPNGVVGPVKGSETWVKTEEGWRVRIEPSGQQYRKLRAAVPASAREAEPDQLPEKLEVSPDKLTFYALFPRQPRLLYIRNGLKTPVDALEIQVDAGKFEILVRPDRIEPHSVGTIKVRYVGTEEGENLETQALLRLKQEGHTQEFTIPIIYNYLDEVSRWMMQQRAKKNP